MLCIGAEKNPEPKHQIAVMNEPNEGDCHCKLSAAPKRGRAGKVWRWDCRVSQPRVHLQKGQWGMEQGPAGITQLLCELTFPTPWLFFFNSSTSFHSASFIRKIWTVSLENVYTQVTRSSFVTTACSKLMTTSYNVPKNIMSPGLIAVAQEYLVQFLYKLMTI